MDIFAALCILTLNYFAADAYIRGVGQVTNITYQNGNYQFHEEPKEDTEKPTKGGVTTQYAICDIERAANCPRITDFPGRVKYRRKGTRAVFRCPKKFDRYGSKFSTCQSDGTWSNDPPLCIKTGCVPLDPSQVVNLDMEVVNGALVKFTCLEEYLLIGETMAYCNGKDWSAPLPRCAAPHELTECDFEEDLCGWVQDDNEEQDWIRQMGPTQTGNTGPKHDHTLGDTGNGHYLYFETSNPTMTGHQANLLSPVYAEDLSPMCFDFWYHILGPDENGHVGSLEVFVLDQSQFIDDDDVQPVFVKEGNKGDAWHRGDIFIDRQVEPYQIAIVATRALSYISDIAIDDVRLYNCTQSTTPPPEFKTSSTTTMATTTDNTTTTIKTTVTSSPTTVITETKTTIKSPTTTTVKTETVTESPRTTSARSTTITESPTKASTAAKTVTTKQTSSTAKPAPVLTTDQTMPTTQTTMKSQKTQSKTSPNSNTWSSVFTKTTMSTPRSTSPVTTTATRVPTKTTEKTKTSQSKTSATTSKPTIASSFTTTSSTASTTQTTKSPVSSQTTSKSSVTTSYDSSTSTPERKSTTKTSTKSPSKPTTFSTKTTTSSEKTTTLPIKTDASTRGSKGSTTSSATSTTSSSSFSTSSSTVTTSSSSSSSSSSFSSSSSTTRKTSTGGKTGETKPKITSSSYNTQTKVSVDSSSSTKTVKPTKSTNDITTKSSIASNTTKENSISVTGSRSKHPEDDTLKPLMIGLCVGIVAGLIIIGVIAYVCVRRRKFYTSRYEDELKPITNSASLQSLNNGHYYQDEEYESES